MCIRDRSTTVQSVHVSKSTVKQHILVYSISVYDMEFIHLQLICLSQNTLSNMEVLLGINLKEIYSIAYVSVLFLPWLVNFCALDVLSIKQLQIVICFCYS